jgi:hypothetical protein
MVGLKMVVGAERDYISERVISPFSAWFDSMLLDY